MPYQALVIRESARLFSGFAPWGRKAFSAREPGAVEVYSPDSVDCTTPTPRRANTIGRMSPSSCGPRRRPSWIFCNSSCSGLASAACSRRGTWSMAACRSRSTSAMPRVVVAVEGVQLVEDVVAALDAGMAKDLPAGDHLEGDAAEAQADLDVGVPRVLALSRPLAWPGAWKWWLQRIRLSAMPRMAARSERLQWRTSGPLALSTWSLW